MHTFYLTDKLLDNIVSWLKMGKFAVLIFFNQIRRFQFSGAIKNFPPSALFTVKMSQSAKTDR